MGGLESTCFCLGDAKRLEYRRREKKAEPQDGQQEKGQGERLALGSPGLGALSGRLPAPSCPPAVPGHPQATPALLCPFSLGRPSPATPPQPLCLQSPAQGWAPEWLPLLRLPPSSSLARSLSVSPPLALFLCLTLLQVCLLVCHLLCATGDGSDGPGMSIVLPCGRWMEGEREGLRQN